MRLLPATICGVFCNRNRYVDGCHGIGADLTCNHVRLQQELRSAFWAFEHGQRHWQARHIEHSEAAFHSCVPPPAVWPELPHMDLHQSSMFICAVLAENHPEKAIVETW